MTDKDVEAGVVPGLERAVAKSKGIEFGALLHTLGAHYSANPYSPAMREILLQINPDCEGRLPKRRADGAARKRPESPRRRRSRPRGSRSTRGGRTRVEPPHKKAAPAARASAETRRGEVAPAGSRPQEALCLRAALETQAAVR